MASTDIAPIAITVAAVGASGPLYSIFSEMGAVMAIMGAMGGGLHAMRHDVSWGTAAKTILSGSVLAFGAGVWAVPLVSRFVGVELMTAPNTIPAMAGGAFFLGFLQERILTALSGKPKK